MSVRLLNLVPADKNTRRPPGSTRPKVPAEVLQEKSLDEVFKEDFDNRSALRKNLSKIITNNAKLRIRANKALKNFSLTRISPPNENYVPFGEKADVKQEKVMKRGLALLKDSKIPHSLRLNLSKADIRRLNLELNDGIIRGKLKLTTLVDEMKKKTKGELFVKKGILSECVAELQAKSLLDSVVLGQIDQEDNITTFPTNGATDIPVASSISISYGNTIQNPGVANSFSVKSGTVNVPGTVILSPDGKTLTFNPSPSLSASTSYIVSVAGIYLTGSNSPASDMTWAFTTEASSVINPPPPGTTVDEEFINKQLALQMETATSPEMQVSFGVPARQNVAGVLSSIKSFELSPSPADVPSYHDFYKLNIAFEHVWTELFDEKISGYGHELYSYFVSLMDSSPVPDEDQQLNTLEDLIKIMNEVRAITLGAAEQDARLQIVKQYVPEVDAQIWSSLDDITKDALYNLIRSLQQPGMIRDDWTGGVKSLLPKELIDSVVSRARQILSTVKIKPSRLEKLLKELETRINEKYAFDIFAPNSINFAILLNYRQNWTPDSYQVGNLVSTRPLAPRESTRYQKKSTVKKSRTQKEMEDTLSVIKDESTSTSRAESDIVDRASKKDVFKQSAEGGLEIHGVSIKTGTSHEHESSSDSSATKKDFRESVLKAAKEYKNEHKVEIDSTISSETEETFTGEITNPNDEITVTYLFYELQRRYFISEKLHKVTPVIMVANEVPRPDQIDEEWLLANEWILKRVILDDEFIPALQSLKVLASNDINLEILQMNVERQSKVVDTITQQIRVGEQNLQIAQNLMQRTQQLYAERSNDSILYWLTSDYDSQIEGQFPDDKETLKLKLDAAKDAFSRAERQIEGLRMQLSSEMSALQTALDKYTDKVKEQFDNKTSILQLRAHIKDNILYYMQAIWRYEQPDQRFFRIYNIKVPLFISSVPNTTVEIYGMVNTVADTVIGMAGELNVRKFPCGTIIPPPQIWENFVSLVEIADIDTLLGFKGNYMIFPLKPNYNNPLIDFMIQDYVVVDDILRANDPDDVGNYDTDELVELIKCIYKKNPADFTDDLRDQFKELLIRRLTSTNLEKELIIIPTGSLYIDSIPGEKPNLEIYKLLSRAEDVKKAQANVRQEELKNILRVVRILKGQLEEQTVDKKIVVEGDSDIHIDPNS